jgi:hypothetical protein
MENTNKYDIIKLFKESNQDNCFIYTIVKKNEDNIEYLVKIIIKLPINNIISFILSGYDIECLITLKKLNKNLFKYKNRLFINSDEHVYCTMSPAVRKIDLMIKNNIKEIITNPELSKEDISQYKEHLNDFPLPEERFDYNTLLAGDYKYYYCFYKYLFYNYNSLISDIDFIDILQQTNKDINTDEQYLEEIQIINEQYIAEKKNPDILKNVESFNFIRCSKNFILLPSYNHIPNINDILSLRNKTYGCIQYYNFRLQIFYKGPLPINNIFDVFELIENEEYTLNEWYELLNELEKEVFDYYQIIFNATDCKTPLSRNSIEIIEGIKKSINIWMTVHSIHKGFFFEANCITDRYDFSLLMSEYICRKNIDEIREYSQMGIFNFLTYNFYYKKKYVPFYYYNKDTTTWDSPYITQKMKDIYKESIIQYSEKSHNPIDEPWRGQKLPDRQQITKWQKQYKIRTMNKTKKIFKGIWSDKINEKDSSIKSHFENTLIEQTGIFSINDKIKRNEEFENIDRETLLKIIEKGSWDGSILQYDCHVKIYGHGIDNGVEKNYILFIIPHKIKNNDMGNILNFQMREIYKNTFVHSTNYDLYLHITDNIMEIEKIFIGDEDEKNDIENDEIGIPLHLMKKQPDDMKIEYVKIRLDKNNIELTNELSLIKFSKEITKNGLKYYLASDILYNGILLDVYKKDYIELGSFPLQLIDDDLLYFTRFLMTIDMTDNSVDLKNSFEINKIGLANINNGPIDNCDDKSKRYYSPMVFIIEPGQKLINLNMIGRDINKLHEPGNLENFIKDMINFVYGTKNFFRFVGYIFPWRDNKRERIYNIFDLIDSDYDYLVKLIDNSIECLIKFFYKLFGIWIDKDNIEIFFHYPNSNADIHLHFKIHKNKYINNYRRFSFSYTRAWHIDEVLYFLKLDRRFFQRMTYTVKLWKEKYTAMLKLQELKTNDKQYTKSLEYVELIGGNNNSNFLNWINKYLNYEKIFKNYILPTTIIDFEIIKEDKSIRMEELYSKYLNPIDITPYNIVSDFYTKIYGTYFNISKAEYVINFINRLLLKNFNNVIFISKLYEYKKKFNINDKMEFIDYKPKYEKLYDLVIISNTFDVFDIKTITKIFLHMKKNIVSLIWALKHLNNDGCVMLVIRETLTPSSNDLLLLLQQYCSINIYYDTTFDNGTYIGLTILCTKLKNIDTLIIHLEKILTFDFNKNTGFLKIKKIISGDIDKFNKYTLKPSIFLFNRYFEYVDCFKNDNGGFEKMNSDIEQLIIINAMVLGSKTYIPKPKYMTYILSLLESKKIKIDNKYIDIETSIKKEEGIILYKLIKKSKAKKILEIGMDYGISSIFILQSLQYFNNKYNNGDGNYKLTSIDPYQKTCWKNLGIQNLKNLNFLSHHKLIEEKSYIILSELVKKTKNYDLIFIDGSHTLDYTSSDIHKSNIFLNKKGYTPVDYILKDILNSYNLVKINGYIVINNALNPGIGKILNYIEKYYPMLIKQDIDIKSMAVYLKIYKNVMD